jgi:hypothetical protein
MAADDSAVERAWNYLVLRYHGPPIVSNHNISPVSIQRPRHNRFWRLFESIAHVANHDFNVSG